MVSSQQEATPKKEVRMKYGIYDETLGWITQQGRVVVSSDPGKLRETIPFGEVRRVWLRRTVDLAEAFRPSIGHTTVHRTTERGTDQVYAPPLPMCDDCTKKVRDSIVETRTN